jgi:hypothetical protein
VPVRLRLECDSTADAESLHRWLRREQAVRVNGELARVTGGESEAMGTLLDVLTLLIGSGVTRIEATDHLALAAALTELERREN